MAKGVSFNVLSGILESGVVFSRLEPFVIVDFTIFWLL